MRTTSTALAATLLLALMAGCHRDEAPDDATAVAPPPATAAPAATPAATPAADALLVAGTGDGAYLTDGSGRAVYVLEGDDGKRCGAECRQVWLPLSGTTPVAGAADVQGPMISTISHDDGSMHATYNGMPLYYFARDTGPGMTLGQDVEDAWGHWTLVRPNGELVPPTADIAGAGAPVHEEAGAMAPTAAGTDASPATPAGHDTPPAAKDGKADGTY